MKRKRYAIYKCLNCGGGDRILMPDSVQQVAEWGMQFEVKKTHACSDDESGRLHWIGIAYEPPLSTLTTEDESEGQ